MEIKKKKRKRKRKRLLTNTELSNHNELQYKFLAITKAHVSTQLVSQRDKGTKRDKPGPYQNNKERKEQPVLIFESKSSEKLFNFFVFVQRWWNIRGDGGGGGDLSYVVSVVLELFLCGFLACRPLGLVLLVAETLIIVALELEELLEVRLWGKKRG